MEYTAFSRNKHIRNPPLETLWRSPFSGICYFCESVLSAEHISRGATPGLRAVGCFCSAAVTHQQQASSAVCQIRGSHGLSVGEMGEWCAMSREL